MPMEVMRVEGINVEGIVRIDNARIWGIEESIVASGYPMATNYCENMYMYEFQERDFKRVRHLGKAKPGSGHDCFLKGIQVQFDLQAPEYIWRQLDRYHFIDYVSSQSKMHMILKFDVDEMCNRYVTEEAVVNLKRYIDQYNNFDWYVEMYKKNYIEDCKLRKIEPDENWEHTIKLRNGDEIEFCKEHLFKIIVANIPCGFMLTARLTTNYLQLKSIINQRSNHKMQEWHYITDWMKNLPLVKDIVYNPEPKKED